MNFKSALYERMIVLMTLNTNLDSELFGGTIFLAALGAAKEIGLDEQLATEMALMAVNNTIHDIRKAHERLREAHKNCNHVMCGNPQCAGCRLHKWATSEKKTHDKKKEPNYEELLRRSRNGPVN